MELVGRIKSKIGRLIREKGWSVYELADKADLTEACIRNWYTKRNYTPSLEAIEKICQAFDISVTELVCDDDEELVPLNVEEKLLIQDWIVLNSKQKTVILMQMDAFLHR